VQSLCEGERYLEMVQIVRLFLSNDREQLLSMLYEKMDNASNELNFEAAADWRDLIESIERYWENQRLPVWLDDAIDTLAAEEVDGETQVFLVTQRGRRVLGRKVFRFAKTGHARAIARVIRGFYLFHLPKEIRVLEDFDDQREIADELSKRFGRRAKITVLAPEDRRLTTAFALTEALSESEIDAARPHATAGEIEAMLIRNFELSSPPKRIEAYDVAHISAKSFAAAWSVSKSAKSIPEEYGFELVPETSELASLSGTIGRRLQTGKALPDLILIDGGKSQVAVGVKAVAEANKHIPVIGAVKPRTKHSEISHFVLEDGEQVTFDPTSAAHNLLKLLRDDAHDLANRIHRDLRDMAYHYELAEMLPSLNEGKRRQLLAAAGSLKKVKELEKETLVKLFDLKTAGKIISDIERFEEGKLPPVLPLIVPLRFVAENGGADDLRPIEPK
jgi:excinuclease ABC subunit C